MDKGIKNYQGKILKTHSKSFKIIESSKKSFQNNLKGNFCVQTPLKHAYSNRYVKQKSYTNTHMENVGLKASIENVNSNSNSGYYEHNMMSTHKEEPKILIVPKENNKNSVERKNNNNIRNLSNCSTVPSEEELMHSPLYGFHIIQNGKTLHNHVMDEKLLKKDSKEFAITKFAASVYNIGPNCKDISIPALLYDDDRNN